MELESQLAISDLFIDIHTSQGPFPGSIQQNQRDGHKRDKTEAEYRENKSCREADPISRCLLGDEDIATDDVGTVAEANHPRETNSKILYTVVCQYKSTCRCP